MRLRRLRVTDLRNVEGVELDTDAPFTVFHGDNAQGKTSLLEAAALLANLSSFRTRRLRELVRWGADACEVEGEVRQEGLTRRYRVRVDGGGRRAWVDDSAPARLSDYFAGIRAVVFAPEQVVMVRGAPAGRRAFLDRAVFTLRPGHLELVRDWRRLLRQRRALLRSPGGVDPAQRSAFDERLLVLGPELALRRARLVARMQAAFGRHHAALAGAPAELRYACSFATREELQAAVVGGADPLRAALARRLAEVARDEVRAGRNLAGPHRDDLRFEIGGRSGRTWASQGQVRSLVLCLKLAELELARSRGLAPIMLLDDLSGELDRARTSALLASLVELGVQCLVTTTDPMRLRGDLPADTRWIEVRGGRAA